METTCTAGYAIYESKIFRKSEPEGPFRVLVPLSNKAKRSSRVPRFEELAKIETEEHIIEFASKYGMIGTNLVATLGDNPEVPAGCFVELVNDWLAEARQARRALRVFKAARHKREDLERMFKVSDDKKTGDRIIRFKDAKDPEEPYRNPGDWVYRVVGPESPQWLKDAVEKSKFPLRMAAWRFLQELINKHIADLAPRVLFAVDGGCLVIQQRPPLLAAMWYQFARTVVMETQDLAKPPVTAMRNIVICAICGEVITDASRSTRKYCSNACSMKAYRIRKKMASK